MRRTLIAVVASVAMSVSVLAMDVAPAVASTSPDTASVSPDAERVLATARATLTQPARASRNPDAAPPHATLALRDLFRALPDLEGQDRVEAEGLLARPTDGASDPQGYGYTVGSKKKCRNHFCVHWVESTADAPPSKAWVNKNLTVMNKVWRSEVKKLGYRKPARDGRRGGNGKFDVYLKELGSRGLYGYCAPERRVRGYQWVASGYCVLDNDFSPSQYGGAAAGKSLRVTAAHEFFHAIQFAYDFGEDRWLMEATATWMEERVADDVNDNVQYLRHGQLGVPATPLDTFVSGGFTHYGNWLFFEFLSKHYGNGIVRAIWQRAGEFRGAGHKYSTAAVKSALRKRGGFAKVYRSFAAANITPKRSYPEGKNWPGAPASKAWTLSKGSAKNRASVRINHMASRNMVVRPAASLKDKRWKLKIAVDGPRRKASPGAQLVIKTKHGVKKRPIRLNRKGKGRAKVSFTSKNVVSVTVVLVNASTRFRCGRGTAFSCQGRAKDNNQKFSVRTVAKRAKSKHRH